MINRLPRQLLVVVTDWTFPDLEIETEVLNNFGIRLLGRRASTAAELASNVRDADGVITQFARLDAAVVDAMDHARVIVRYGVGVDNVDLNAARERGIPVCNVPDYCVNEVADHTLSLILAATRQIVPHHEQVRSGRWQLAVKYEKMRSLRDLAVGTVGFGRLGRAVAERLHGFGCRILAFDPALRAADFESRGVQGAAFDELIALADIVTLHCPLSAETRGLISRDVLLRMKPDAILVNTARGQIVDTNALLEALESGRLGAVALDVCDPEPIPAEHPLLKFPRVVFTPHVASVSPTAMRKLRETAARIAGTAVLNNMPPNVVNGVAVPRNLIG